MSGQSPKEEHAERCESDHEEWIELLEITWLCHRWIVHIQEKHDSHTNENNGNDTTNDAGTLHLTLERSEACIDSQGYQSQREDVKPNAHIAAHREVGVLFGEEGQRRTILMESHPEENDHRKNKHQSGDTFLGFSRCKLLNGSIAVLCLLDSLHSMGKPALASKIDNSAQNQRYAGYTKAKAIAAIEGFQIAWINIGSIVDETFAGKILIGNPLGHRGCKHSTNVDGHVEQ